MAERGVIAWVPIRGSSRPSGASTMSEQLIQPGAAGLVAAEAAAHAYMLSGRASSTRRAYRADLAGFVRWCGDRGLEPPPASQKTIALYLADRARQGYRVATLKRSLVAI